MKRLHLAALGLALLSGLAAAQNTVTVDPASPVLDTTPDVYRGTSVLQRDAASASACAEAAVADAKATNRKPGKYTYGCQPGRTTLTVTVTKAPTCGAQPKPATRNNDCPTGTTGVWPQTSTFVTAPYPQCWTAGEWLPKEKPADKCPPVVVVPPVEPPTTGDVPVTSQGAKCDGRTDDTAAIRAALALAKTRKSYATLPAGTCVYSDVIQVDGTKLKGQGDTSVLASTSVDRTAFFMRGDGAELRSFKFAGAVAGDRRAAWEMTRVTLFGARNFVIDSITIEGSSAAGIQFAESTGPGRLTNNKVRNTNSDSIHMTDKAHDIVLEGNTVEGSGDDGIAVVSYRSDGGVVKNIQARNNIIRGNKWGRGMSVVGGVNVLYEFNQVENSGQYACMIFAQEQGSYNTYGADQVVAQRNTLKNCGSNSTGHGAVLISSAGGGANTNIKVVRNDIIQSGQNGIKVEGAESGIVLDSNRIAGAAPSYIAPGDVTRTDFTGGVVGHTGGVVVVPPPVVDPPPVVLPPVTPPTVSELPKINEALIPAAVPGSNERLIRSTSAQPYKDAGGIGAFRTVCDYSHFNFDDFLVFPGGVRKSHLHMYFGNGLTNANSTAATIQTTGDGSCRGGIVNRSAYWVPAMIDTSTGAPMKPGTEAEGMGIDVYYKTGYHGVRDAAIKPVPTGLRMITGDSKSRAGQSAPSGFAIVEYGCNDANRQRTIPSCGNGSWLYMHVNFPQCWDGRNLDSPDHKSHMAYATDGAGCNNPAFPVPLPEVSYVIKYRVGGAGTSSWRLSSDMSDAPAGSSGHGDYVFGWEAGIIDSAVANIVNKGLSGGSDLVGDGRSIYK